MANVNLLNTDIVKMSVEEAQGKIHKLASTNPLMNDENFVALKESLTDVGQLKPIILYRGLVVDGRNRLNAFKDLGWSDIAYETLPNNTTMEELERIVNGFETRRHQTKTQLAIKALRMVQSKGITQAEAASIVGVSVPSVKKAASVARMSEAVINGLWEGEKYRTLTGSLTDSLNAIDKDLKARSLTEDVTERDVESESVNSPKVEATLGFVKGNDLTELEKQELIAALGGNVEPTKEHLNDRMLMLIVKHPLSIRALFDNHEPVSITELYPVVNAVQPCSPEKLANLLIQGHGIHWNYDLTTALVTPLKGSK